jgi:hypothetical protein
MRAAAREREKVIGLVIVLSWFVGLLVTTPGGGPGAGSQALSDFSGELALVT